MDDCSGIPQLGYGEFSEWLHKKVGNQRIPISGSLEVTMRCNLRCQHCYIPIERRASRNVRELSLPEIKRILDEITDAGCLWLLLTGGDPFIRRDFLDIHTYARHKGLILTLFTNGTLITPRIADYLAEWRPFNMEITLYGATQETYERVTGIPGSYKRCMRGIELLLERKLPLGLKTMVMTINQHELNLMKSFAASLGLHFRFDAILHSALDRSSYPHSLRLAPSEIVSIENHDPDLVRIWPDHFQKLFDNIKPSRNMYLCNAGKQSFHIDAAGRLTLCLTARQPFFDLRDNTFKEGWESFLPQVTDQQYKKGYPCVGCRLRTMCPQCPAMAELEYGETEKRVEFLCQVTRLRKEAFVSQTKV